MDIPASTWNVEYILRNAHKSCVLTVSFIVVWNQSTLPIFSTIISPIPSASEAAIKKFREVKCTSKWRKEVTISFVTLCVINDLIVSQWRPIEQVSRDER